MHRCLELAEKGAGKVAPNPMVGALLVYENEIIGEGYHEYYGGPHAEVNCIDSVEASKTRLITESTLYVSLEPCAHFGKTPPCADLIIKHNIKTVIIGCRDPFPEVNGKGIEKLLAAGIEVQSGILEQQCRSINKRFFTFHKKHRPYVILKWAETSDKKIGNYGNNRLHITGSSVNTLVHKWRSEESAIMVGTTTAALDDPMLTNRLWTGDSPVRVVIDASLRLPSSLHLFDKSAKTIVFNLVKHGEENNIYYYQVTEDVNLVHQVVNALYQLKILSIIIEGGAKLLQSFIDVRYWDEARVITNNNITAPSGVPSPMLNNCLLNKKNEFGNEVLNYYVPAETAD